MKGELIDALNGKGLEGGVKQQEGLKLKPSSSCGHGGLFLKSFDV